jgi:hypothetical protein
MENILKLSKLFIKSINKNINLIRDSNLFYASHYLIFMKKHLQFN